MTHRAALTAHLELVADVPFGSRAADGEFRVDGFYAALSDWLKLRDFRSEPLSTRAGRDSLAGAGSDARRQAAWRGRSPSTFPTEPVRDGQTGDPSRLDGRDVDDRLQGVHALPAPIQALPPMVRRAAPANVEFRLPGCSHLRQPAHMDVWICYSRIAIKELGAAKKRRIADGLPRDARESGHRVRHGPVVPALPRTTARRSGRGQDAILSRPLVRQASLTDRSPPQARFHTLTTLGHHNSFTGFEGRTHGPCSLRELD